MDKGLSYGEDYIKNLTNQPLFKGYILETSVISGFGKWKEEPFLNKQIVVVFQI